MENRERPHSIEDEKLDEVSGGEFGQGEEERAAHGIPYCPGCGSNLFVEREDQTFIHYHDFNPGNWYCVSCKHFFTA